MPRRSPRPSALCPPRTRRRPRPSPERRPESRDGDRRHRGGGALLDPVGSGHRGGAPQPAGRLYGHAGAGCLGLPMARRRPAAIVRTELIRRDIMRRLGTRVNVAAVAGRWSARHRRVAIWGWLSFVLVAFLVGGFVGQRYLTVPEMGNGESGRALQAYDKANFPK